MGAYWNALVSPFAANSASSDAARSRGNVEGSGKPPANEIRPGTPSSESIAAMPSPTSPPTRRAKRCASGVTAMTRI